MLGGTALVLSSCAPLFSKDKRPNFVIIMADDQRYDTMQWMPQTQALIFDHGITFSQSISPTPLCCPARACTFTGLYAHNEGVYTNLDKLSDKHETVFMALHDHGYYTGLVGKYLNTWLGEMRPEFDFWVSQPGSVAAYENPNLNVNGKWGIRPGYITDVETNYVLQFLDQASKQNKPFILMYAARAPHAPATPAKQDKNLLENLPPYRPPGFNEADVSLKPSSISGLRLMDAQGIAMNDNFRRRQILTLIALDRSVGAIINKLQETGEIDNTVVIYTSDHGIHWGEHRLSAEKNSEYEVSLHVPFGMRYPPLVPKPYVDDHLVAHIDLVPMIYDLAGVSGPAMDGTSLVKVIKGEPWRDHLLIQGKPERGYWVGIRTTRYVYVETENDMSELYDLQTDPFEIQNLINDPQYQSIISDLKAKLDAEKQAEPSL